MEISKKIISLRKQNKLTKKQMAKIIQICPKTLKKFENGESLPKLKHIRNIAHYFNVTYEYLLDE